MPDIIYPATLYIVATPIGNLADITLRAIDILKRVDYIAAEDTRHSLYLMQHYGIGTPMLAYHEHSGEAQTEKLLMLLQQGKSLALISDAGTPLISDPGYPLVREAHRRSIPVVPVPGASALIAILCSSGLPTDRFSFQGFLPAKLKARQDALLALKGRQETLVFYEAPHRIAECLQDMCDVFGGQRLVTIGRELTKSFETIRQYSLADMVGWVNSDSNQQRGEIVLVVEGAKENLSTDNEVLPEEAVRLIGLLAEAMPPKMMSKVVATHYGLPKKLVYDYVLGLKK